MKNIKIILISSAFAFSLLSYSARETAEWDWYYSILYKDLWEATGEPHVKFGSLRHQNMFYNSPNCADSKILSDLKTKNGEPILWPWERDDPSEKVYIQKFDESKCAFSSREFDKGQIGRPEKK